jgi:predicted ArsR family transcriptional regulator
MSSPAAWETVHVLAEPTRRRVFDSVRAADEPVTRDGVAAAVGISRRLAAFHLDLLADAHLVEVDYARPAGRTGPGAGRPAKRYRPADVDVTVSVPPRRYDVAARILARAIEQCPSGDTRAAALEIASDEGRRVGALRRQPGKLSAAATLDAAADVLADLGYEPHHQSSTSVRLRNCPFHAVVDVATELVCAVNHSFIDGVLCGLGTSRSVGAALDGVPPDCCVTVARR